MTFFEQTFGILLAILFIIAVVYLLPIFIVASLGFINLLNFLIVEPIASLIDKVKEIRTK